MPEKMLYGQLKTTENPDGFDEMIPVDPEDPYTSFTGDEVLMLNINGVLKGIRAKWFRGKTGNQGLPGNVAWGDLTVSALGAALITAGTTAAQRLVLGISALGSNLVTSTTPAAMRIILGLGNTVTHNYGSLVNTVAQGNDIRFVPAKVPVPFWGEVADIPTGWYLCNGENGTPDLRNKFIVGAGSLYAVGDTGGSKDAIVVQHIHTGITEGDTGHKHNYNFPPGNTNIANSGNDTSDRYYNTIYAESVRETSTSDPHTHNFTTNSTGNSASDANLPPYFAMNYIMHF